MMVLCPNSCYNRDFFVFSGARIWPVPNGIPVPFSPWFIQARLCKIQGFFKDFSKTFLQFSRTENLR